MSTTTFREAKAAKIALNETLTTLLEELGEECQNLLELLAQLKMIHLSSGQMEDILAELTASVVHLHAHTDGLDDLISEQLERF
ncbi:MAG: hypothetical protein AAGB97_09315 [Dehalococcoidia bacterium]|nr:hypothetical protein [Chloroflexota bacterium]MBT9160946.1 hypothetical protein [Chloroflexota bacterium]